MKLSQFTAIQRAQMYFLMKCKKNCYVQEKTPPSAVIALILLHFFCDWDLNIFLHSISQICLNAFLDELFKVMHKFLGHLTTFYCKFFHLTSYLVTMNIRIKKSTFCFIALIFVSNSECLDLKHFKPIKIQETAVQKDSSIWMQQEPTNLEMWVE